MNQKFSFEKLPLEGAYIIRPFCAEDRRGCFVKDYAKKLFVENGLDFELKESLFTKSNPGVIRGVHFQIEKPQPKLVRCVVGEVYDVMVDLRRDSPTYKQWMGFYLSEDNMNQLWIPSGFGHGYLVIKPSLVSYKCAEDFYPEFDGGVRYDDPEIGIEWPIHLANVKEPILSDKDLSLPFLKHIKKLF